MKKLLLVVCMISICIIPISHCDNTINQNSDSKLLHESLLLNVYLWDTLQQYKSRSFLEIYSINPSNDNACSSSYDGTYDMVITFNGSLDGVTFGKVEIAPSADVFIFTIDMDCPFVCSGAPLSFGTSTYPNDQIIINSSYIDIPDMSKFNGMKISDFKDIYGKIIYITDVNYYLCTHYK